MASFKRHSETKLYISSEQEPGSGYFAYFLLDDSDFIATISYTDSWSEYIGLYVFIKSEPATDKLNALATALGVLFPVESLTNTSAIWITFEETTEVVTVNKFMKIGLRPEDNTTFLELQFKQEVFLATFVLGKDSEVVIQSDSEGNLDGLIIEYPLSLENAPVPVPPKDVIIPLTGQYRGCLTAEIALNESNNRTAGMPDRGFYFFTTKPDKPDDYLRQYYPLFAKEPIDDTAEVYMVYQMRFDPLAPFDPNRSEITYLGIGYMIVEIPEPPYRQIELLTGKGLAQGSCYISIFGGPVKIKPMAEGTHPGGYVLNELPPDSPTPYYMAPKGDFEIINESGEGIPFACGLSGTEFFKLKPDEGENKTYLRFTPNQPACVREFPFELASPVGPPTNPTASLFSNKYRTSWTTVIRPEVAIPYVSQPKGAALYGKSEALPVDTGLLGHVTNPFLFTSNEKDFFPMVPYGGLETVSGPGLMSDDDMQALETIVLSKQRHATISTQIPPKAILLQNASDDDVVQYATTPAGLLVKTTQTPEGSVVKWDQFLLAKNGSYEMALNDPADPVINAMQSSNVFLVVSNAKHLQGFANLMGIGDWELQANIGAEQSYGDYRNLMIFKGRKGKLYDPKDVSNCLVANPKKWNQSEDFSIPQTDGNEDPAQLIILSNWLQNYFKNAQEQEGAYFSKFNTIATDDNWTGILFLRVDIKKMPTNLSGIIAGVTNPSAFNAHHLGIEINPVHLDEEGTPVLSKPSSMFGLIYYQDSGFSDEKPLRAIPPSSSGTYNFRLLSLKVLFENTAVKSFESYAQLTLNQLFGSSVSKTFDKENIYKNVLLAGSLQINNGQPVYSLGSQKEDAFYLESNIINKVEITEVYLSNRSLENAAQQISWFGMSGFIDFKILQGKVNEEKVAYDLFSFGNQEGVDELRKGLQFTNLGIAMTFPKDLPQQSTLNFSAGEIYFNPSPSVSTPRIGSLYLQLGLTLENLIVGNVGQTPKDQGFLDMVSDIRLSGPGKEGWYGLRYKLNMGTPGALAENAGFNAFLLLSWSPSSQKEDDYRAGIGIALPGSGDSGKLLSLQGVLKLSIGQILLRLVPDNSGGQKVFMLLFTQIALKFLGLLSIPPGNTLFYLFGNPNARGDSSALGWYAMYRKKEPNKSLSGIRELIK